MTCERVTFLAGFAPSSDFLAAGSFKTWLLFMFLKVLAFILVGERLLIASLLFSKVVI